MILRGLKRAFQSAILSAVVFATSASGQQYPDRSVRVIVPYAAGGPTDLVARVVADRLEKQLNNRFLIENRPGANAIVGAEIVAKAVPDGYTLLLAGAAALTPVITKNVPFDLLKAFAPISLIYNGTLYVFSSAAIPARNLQEFVAYSKSNPGKINYASNAGVIDILGAVLQKSLGIEMVIVPYKGAALATGVAANESQITISSLPVLKSQIDAGKVRVLALLAKSRSSLTPEVPTVVESGHPEMVTGFSTGMWAPAGTPSEIVNRLNRALTIILGTSEVKDRLRPIIATDPTATTPEGFRQVMLDEIEFFVKAAKLANYEPQ
jgi:tripartite-type tricarboxylate transporter receptor subunit TctC